MTAQAEALRLADELEAVEGGWNVADGCCAELRRLHAENEALRKATDDLARAAIVTDDMRSAVRWAPSSARWSEKLREYFGPDARLGIDALERQIAQEYERRHEIEALLRQALEALETAQKQIAVVGSTPNQEVNGAVAVISQYLENKS